MNRSYLAICSFLAAVVIAAPLWAADNGDPSDIESEFDMSSFHAASTGEDGFSIEHAEVLDHLQFGFHGIVQLEDNPVSGVNNDSKQEFSTRLMAGHIGAALGLFDYSQLAVVFPLYLDNGTRSPNPGAGDLRVIPKGAYRGEAGDAELGIGLSFPLIIPTGDSARLLGEGTFAFEPRLAMDAIWGKMRFILNVGYRWRETIEEEVLRGPELTMGLGLEFDIIKSPGHLRAIVEVDSATQTGDFFGADVTPLVVVGGVRHRFDNGIGLGAVLGAGATQGLGAPDFRALIGASYIFIKKTEEDKGPATVSARDLDVDGIEDSEDRCPEEAEDFDRFEDEDGCPEMDNDQDEIPDGKDDCPNEAENKNGMDDEDGCPDFDTDGDTIPDHRDACPEEAEDMDAFEDHDGCLEDDNDLDGIPDVDDECPLLPETFNEYKDSDGCTDFFAVEGNKIVPKRRMRFEGKDSAELHESVFEMLDELAGMIIANPDWSEVHIFVHTSGRGKAEERQQLSEERAMALMRILVAGGVIPERLVAAGKGNSEPLADVGTKEGRLKNDRVELVIKKRGEK